MGLLGCAKCVVIFFNVWFALIGFILLALGGVLKFGLDTILGVLSPMLGSLTSAIPGAANLTTNGQNAVTGLLDSFGLLQILSDCATSLLVIGVFLFVIGCLGCCGACCKVKWMVIIYAVFIAVIFTGQVVAIILWFAMRPQMETAMRDGLDIVIKTQYGGTAAFDGPSIGMNLAMNQLKCCGVNNYTDFYSATKWNRNITTTINNQNLTFVLVAPLICCKMDGEFPNLTPVDANCTHTPTTVNSNFQTGCWDSVINMTSQYGLYCIGAVAGLTAIEIMLFAFAIIIIVKNNKVEPE